MSVHAGIWNIDDQPVDRDLITSISRQTAAYGPDGEQAYVKDNLGVLYRPFHTTPESLQESQPYKFSGGRIMTWDGRLDNREDLISILSGTLTIESADLVIVSKAYERWGTDCFAKLVGDWSLALWDADQRELILARDYIGIRQLFYYPKPGRLVWCNHLAPLALCSGRLSLCDEYIAGCLASLPHPHLTPYREILSVPPGSFVQIRARGLSVQPYWTFDSRRLIACAGDKEYEEQYRHLFRQAVRRRLRACSPILADLSGGFDSSSIVCMADDILRREGKEAPTLDTFSLYDSRDCVEEGDLDHIKSVEERRGKTGFHTDLGESTDAFPFTSSYIPFPRFANRPDFSAALLRAVSAGGHRVLLSGEGGDEVNGQSLDPRVQLAELLRQFRILEFGGQITAWSLLIRKRPWIQIFLQTLLQLMPIGIRARLSEQGKLEPWVNTGFARAHSMVIRQMGSVEGLPTSRPRSADAIQTIDGLSRLMSCTAPSLVEKRYPYLDQQLVEFLTSVPFNQLLRPGQRRSLMKRALADLLPPQILTRKSKATFEGAFLRSLNKHWDKFEVMFHSPHSACKGYIKAEQMRTALSAMRNGRCPKFMTRLLNAICLEIWLRDSVSRGVIASRPPVPVEAWERAS